MSSIWQQMEEIRHTFTDNTHISREALEWMLDEHKRVLRNLKEANGLLEQIYQYTKANNIGELGQNRVEALIEDHQAKTRFMHDVSIAHKMGDPEVHKLLKERGL